MTAVLTLRRTDLVAANACEEWLAVFDEICAMRGADAAPWVRRGGVSRRDPGRLRIELTPLAQLWMARDARGAVAWLREQGVIGPVYVPRLRAEGLDLRGADLRDAYLSGADLRGANLRDADLRGAYLRDAYLSGADLGAYLNGADLRGADLRDADLRGADLRAAYLPDADLRGANLRGADLRDAYLRDAYLSGADLSGADLSGADLCAAYLPDADLRGAYLSGARRWSDDVPVPGWVVRDGVIAGRATHSVTLRALLIEDAARVAENRHPAVARLLRRADVSGEDLLCAAVDLERYPSASRALWAIAVGDLDAAMALHCDATGLDRDAWIAATLDEQRATLAGGVTA